jgi:hypothetical protein
VASPKEISVEKVIVRKCAPTDVGNIRTNVTFAFEVKIRIDLREKPSNKEEEGNRGWVSFDCYGKYVSSTCNEEML